MTLDYDISLTQSLSFRENVLDPERSVITTISFSFGMVTICPVADLTGVADPNDRRFVRLFCL